jgi:hypothetical protein
MVQLVRGTLDYQIATALLANQLKIKTEPVTPNLDVVANNSSTEGEG